MKSVTRDSRTVNIFRREDGFQVQVGERMSNIPKIIEIDNLPISEVQIDREVQNVYLTVYCYIFLRAWKNVDKMKKVQGNSEKVHKDVRRSWNFFKKCVRGEFKNITFF